MPIVERMIEREGFLPSGILMSKDRVVHRTYVKPKKVQPEDVVVTQQEQTVTEMRPVGKKGRLQKVTRTVLPITPKELLDPRVRAELGLEAVGEDEDDIDPHAARGTSEHGEEEEEELDEEEPDEEEEEEEEGGEPTLLQQFVESDWKAAVAMIEAASKDSNEAALSEFVGAEMRRMKPRPSVVKAFVAAGLGEAADFEKAEV